MPGGRRQGRGRARRPSRAERHGRARAAGGQAAVKRAESAIEILLPQRRSEPESVVAHLGPTNSGKTYHALEVQVSVSDKTKHFSFSFCLPLQPLALRTN